MITLKEYTNTDNVPDNEMISLKWDDVSIVALNNTSRDTLTVCVMIVSPSEKVPMEQFLLIAVLKRPSPDALLLGLNARLLKQDALGRPENISRFVLEPEAVVKLGIKIKEKYDSENR